jgi:Tol biopolymer transport system component/DNA-binding winged helix-turn-helix (wHTH) protein
MTDRNVNPPNLSLSPTFRAPSPHGSDTQRSVAMPQRFSIGDFRVDVGGLKLIDHDHVARRLTPKTMGVLMELALRAGETVARDDLLSGVWPDTCPTPEVLTQAIKELRKAFQDDQRAPLYIETIPKVGYRLLKLPIWHSDEFRRTGDTANDPSAPLGLVAADLTLAAVGDHSSSTSTRFVRLFRLSWPTIFITCAALGYFLIAERASPLVTNKDSTDSPMLSAVDLSWSEPRIAQIKQSVRMLTSAPGIEQSPAISPDGKWLAYVVLEQGQSRIWVRDMASPEARRLTREASSELAQGRRELLPRFSKDGLSLAYLRYSSGIETGQPNPVAEEKCEIYAQRIFADSPRKLMDCPAQLVLPFEWPEPDEILYSAYTADASSSTAKPFQSVAIYLHSLSRNSAVPLVPAVPGEARYDWHAMRSPDRQWLAFRRGGNADSTLYIAQANGGNARALTQLAQGARGFDWLPDSSGVIASITQDRETSLVVVPRNSPPKALGIAGQSPNISADGRVVFNTVHERAGLYEFDLKNTERAGKLLFASTSTDESPSLSPDGRVVVFQSARGGIFQMWLATRDTIPHAITQTSAKFSGVTWRDDGSHFLIAQQETMHADSVLLEYEMDRSQLREIKPPPGLGLIIRVAYADAGVASDPGDYLILSSKNGQRRLQRWRVGANWQLQWELLDIGSFQKDAATQRIYFTRVANNTLFARMPDGASQVVFSEFEPQFLWHWRVLDGSVFYSSPGLGTGVMALHKRVLKTGIDQLIRVMPTGDLALDVARQIAIVPVPIPAEMDIASLQL